VHPRKSFIQTAQANNMQKILKYFVLGVLFFLVMYFLDYGVFLYYYHTEAFSSSFFSWFDYGFFAWLAVPVVTTVGMLKKPLSGFVFGLSSILPNLLLNIILLNGDFNVLFSVLFYILPPVLGYAVFGYLPAKLYFKYKSDLMLLLGFMAGFIPLLLINNPNAIPSHLLVEFMLVSGFGLLSMWLCTKRLNTTETPTPTAPFQPQTIKCKNCGEDNPSKNEFCGLCGNPLREKKFPEPPPP
jgi:hypothetical protein